jgi:DNA repair protein RadC
MEEVNGKYIIKRPVTSEQLLQLTKTALIKESERRPHFSNNKIAMNYLVSYYNNQKNEIFVVLLLDSKHKLIAAETLDIGTVNYINIHPRKLIEAIIKHNATAVIISHNHPSGNPQPSKADIALTDALKPLLVGIDVELVDHIVVAGGSAVSIKSL